MNLADTREAVATALSTVPGYNVRPRPLTTPVPQTGDGWILVTSMKPSAFTNYVVAFTAVVVLSADEATAEEHLEEDAAELLTAIEDGEELFPADLSLEAQVLVTASGTPIYAAAITFTMEVD
jgi:hypothetical protein